MVKLLVTIFYVGFLPRAPGTFGSVVAIFIGYWIQLLGGFPLLIFSTTVLFFLGWVLTHQYLLKYALPHDPQEIVIDEVVGQWITYLPISLYVWVFELTIFSKPLIGWLVALILFRVFDIWKPWPVRWADKKNSSLGVMLDDFLAGIYAGLTVCILIIISKLGEI